MSLSQINSKSSYALCHLVPKACRVSALSPLQLLKAVKNDTEAQGMRNSHVSGTRAHIHPSYQPTHTLSPSHTLTPSHPLTLSHLHTHNQIRDAAALCEYFNWLEEEVVCVCMCVGWERWEGSLCSFVPSMYSLVLHCILQAMYTGS